MLNVLARSKVAKPTMLMLIVLAILPAFNFNVGVMSLLASAMIFAVGGIGVDVLGGYSGQFSFGQFAFYAVGGYAMVIFYSHAGFPIGLAIVAAVLVAAIVGGLLGAILVRLEHFGSALGTFFFAAVIGTLLQGTSYAKYTGGPSGLYVPITHIAGVAVTSSTGLYYLALVVLAISAFVSIRYLATRAGRSLRVIKQNDIVAAVLGIRVNRERVVAQALSAGLAGFGGCIYAMSVGYLSPAEFDVSASIEIFAIAAVGGFGSIGGSILGGVFYFIVQHAAQTVSPDLSAVVFAIALLIVVETYESGLYGIGEAVALVVGRVAKRGFERSGHTPQMKLTRRLRGPRHGSQLATSRGGHLGFDVKTVNGDGPALPASELRADTGREDGLVVSRASVTFGAVRAVSDMDLIANLGEVHCVVGPNGAGKTTLLNLINGLVPSAGGTVTVGGKDISSLSAHTRRAEGIGRSFQHPALVADMSVLDNVTMGGFARHDKSLVMEMLNIGGTRKANEDAAERAAWALRLVKFDPGRWHVRAKDLTMGEQKKVDIARGLACVPRIVLVDEPTAGLDNEDIGLIAEALLTVRASGIGLVVIAHNVKFVREIGDRCTVMDFGHVVSTGDVERTLADPHVAEIFTGIGGAYA